MIFHSYVSLPEGNLDDDPSTIFHIAASFLGEKHSTSTFRSQKSSKVSRIRSQSHGPGQWGRSLGSHCAAASQHSPHPAHALDRAHCDAGTIAERESQGTLGQSLGVFAEKNTMVSCVSWRPPFFYSGLLGFVILLWFLNTSSEFSKEWSRLGWWYDGGCGFIDFTDQLGRPFPSWRVTLPRTIQHKHGKKCSMVKGRAERKSLESYNWI